jgi:hypothetical protein
MKIVFLILFVFSNQSFAKCIDLLSPANKYVGYGYSQNGAKAYALKNCLKAFDLAGEDCKRQRGYYAPSEPITCEFDSQIGVQWFAPYNSWEAFYYPLNYAQCCF